MQGRQEAFLKLLRGKTPLLNVQPYDGREKVSKIDGVKIIRTKKTVVR